MKLRAQDAKAIHDMRYGGTVDSVRLRQLYIFVEQADEETVRAFHRAATYRYLQLCEAGRARDGGR